MHRTQKRTKVSGAIRSIRYAPIHLPTRPIEGGGTTYGTPETLLVLDENPGGVYPAAWVFAGGSIQQDEPLGKALCREVREETGVTIKRPPVVFSARSSEGRFVLVVGITHGDQYPLVPPRNFRTEEIRQVRWFPIDRLPLTGGEPHAEHVGLDSFNARMLHAALENNWEKVEGTGCVYDFTDLMHMLRQFSL